MSDTLREELENVLRLQSGSEEVVRLDVAIEVLEKAAQRIAEIERERDEDIATAIASEELNPWKRVLINALIVDFIFRKAHETDPELALAELLAWEQEIALDPKVSSAAFKLQTEAAAKALEGAAARCISLKTTGQRAGHRADQWDWACDDCAKHILDMAAQKRGVE